MVYQREDREVIPVSRSRTLEVYEGLRSDIVAARFRPGERLRIDGLCAALGTSPGAVREALSRLSSEGLVVARPQRGFYVAPISLDELRDLTAVRCHVECLCLERAIEVGPVSWEAGIIAAYHRLSKTPLLKGSEDNGLDREWTQLHSEFHDSLVAACDSAWWLRLRQQLFLQSERYRQLAGQYSGGTRDIDGEHKAVMDATIRRDKRGATTILSEHLNRTSEILMSSLVFSEEIGS